jgi:hypothetical protein
MNFADALNTTVSDIKRPPLMPQGTYDWIVTGFKMDTIAQGAWDVVDFTLKAIEAHDDVDPEDLANFGNVAGQVRTRRFMFDTQDKAKFERSLFDIKQFCTVHCGVEGDDNVSLKELIAATTNQKVSATIGWRADKTNPEVQYDEIKKTMKIAG